MIYKFLFGLVFLLGTLAIAFTLSAVSSIFSKFLEDKLNRKVKYFFLVLVTISFDVMLVFLFSWRTQWNLIDSWFTCSILLIAIVWLPGYFRPFQENASRTVANFSSGINSGSISIFRLSSHPFVIGSLIVGITGLLASVVLYLPYIL
ncbi:hypothetical protein [Guptibacillus hwajinpoensis]|uniref:Phosphoglycerol transferase MdoB-like AlkP superfamily enzyme n=1 Tax=Guptibacillus hwajinpoensis TaxID=208199 RepID=A0ABU0K6H2_9BACL|nr:hypothetical protein [Alkalihalobacillus hemicentroti]MDQ0483938.1 phosphoglycerol transferase MdoB-like AlkP superfamily enzyme [Alkalihalobacillus hemicentroti]